jgi:hypothetical protein
MQTFPGAAFTSNSVKEVSKEHASAFIYRDGKRVRWEQLDQ